MSPFPIGTAKRDARIAVCGTAKVTCAQVDPAKPEKGATCTLRPAAAHTDERTTQRTPCFPGLPDCAYPATLSQVESHAVVLRWVVPFLERFLGGTSRLEPFLATPPPPGVIVEHVP